MWIRYLSIITTNNDWIKECVHCWKALVFMTDAGSRIQITINSLNIQGGLNELLHNSTDCFSGVLSNSKSIFDK